MNLVTRILCPTDFSAAATNAIRYAEILALSLNAELFLFHAFDAPTTWTNDGQEHPLDQSLQEKLDAVLPDSPLKDKIHRLQHVGVPGEITCWIAQELRCNLIVMGTHGHSGLKHMLFGSVAEYVLQHARCPVLTIRDHDANEPPLERPEVMPILAPRYM